MSDPNIQVETEYSLPRQYEVGPQYYTQYFIDNFRSLRGFTVRLEEGLNVLVGPNGSGKTNFIEFLDFLSNFLVDSASTATSKAGGLARVFSQETLKSNVPRVVASISGLANLKPYTRDDDRTLFRFQYDIDIRYSKHHATIFVASESIKFKSCFWSDLAVFVDRTVGTVSVKRKNPLEDTVPEVTIGKRLLTRGPRNPLRFRGRSVATLGKRSVSDNTEIPIPALAIDQSILSARSLVPAFDAVRDALTRGRSFNLIPARAREPDDISRPPIIQVDGSGLSSTLYHMQRAPRAIPPRGLLYRRFDSESLQKIVTWTSLVLPELEAINTTADPQTGKYLAYLVVKTASDTLRVPLQSASDGTLKWLSFASLLVTSGSIYSLEEPENYLHPRMQSFLVDLIRDALDREHPGYFIMTTHSESVINQCKPEELLLFEFCEGRTRVERLKYPNKVRDEINRTGFGLGYYYAANAIS